jgi:hypothetical protein
MRVIRPLFSALAAVLIVGAFIYAGALSVDSARKKHDPVSAAPPAAPEIQAAVPKVADYNSDTRVGTESFNIEIARAACLEEMKATSNIALEGNSHCNRYAQLLDGQFASVRSSQPYQAPSSSPEPMRSSQPVQTASVSELPSHAELAERCGNRFDDIGGRDLQELKRRLRIRQESLVAPDWEEIQELQCRIHMISIASTMR